MNALMNFFEFFSFDFFQEEISKFTEIFQLNNLLIILN